MKYEFYLLVWKWTIFYGKMGSPVDRGRHKQEHERGFSEKHLKVTVFKLSFYILHLPASSVWSFPTNDCSALPVIVSPLPLFAQYLTYWICVLTNVFLTGLYATSSVGVRFNLKFNRCSGFRESYACKNLLVFSSFTYKNSSSFNVKINNYFGNSILEKGFDD